MMEIPEWSTEVPIAAVAALATVIVLLLALFIEAKVSQRPRRRLPPGPRGWPLLGCLPLLGTLPNQSLYELSKKYGPLMFMRLGSVKALVVTSSKLAEEILKKHDLVMSSRPSHIVPNHVMYNSTDIAWVGYGPHWRYVRKVATLGLLTTKRVNHFREVREREVLAVLHFILEESQRGNDVNITQCFNTITMNNITQMMMSKSYSVLQQPESGSKAALPSQSLSLSACFREMFLIMGAFNIADFVPILKPFDPQGFQKRAKAVSRDLDGFLEELIDERRRESSVPRTESYKEDFVDALLRLGQTEEFEERLSMDVIKAILLDMLSAAGDTSSVTSLWALTELMRNPRVMRRVKEELDAVVGPHRLVQEEDLPKLEYLTAVMKETFRLHPAGPLLIPHVSTEDVEIEGCHIPASTCIFVNVWGLHRDPAVWERPLEFNPDRFLNSSIDFRGQDFALIPFGSGRRMCPGINLGTLMVMYPLSVLLHAVDFTLPKGQKPEDLDMSEMFGLVLFKKLPLNVLGKARLPNHIIYPPQEAQK